MSMWKKLMTAVTAGCLVVTGFSAGGASAEPVAPAVAPVVAQPDHQPFKVLSYNARANFFADQAQGIPVWATRQLQVYALLRANNPDIFVIYEAEFFDGPGRVPQNMPADFIKAFGAEYAYYNGPTNDPRHGTKLMFYRKSRFRLAPASDTQGIVPVPNPYGTNGMVGAAKCGSMGENRYLSYVKLQDIKSGRSYFVAAMHPTHQKECFKGRDVNRAVLQTTIETKAIPTGMSVIAMGDMNTDWECRETQGSACFPQDDDVISRIEAGGANYNLYRSDRHSAPTTAGDATMNPSWYSDAIGSPHRTIDYIFHSGVDMTMSNPQVDSGKYLGGKDTPSDHYAISATVQPSVFATESTLDTSGPGTNPGTKMYFTRVNADACADKVAWNPALNSGATTIRLSNCNGVLAKPPFNDNVPSASSNTEFYFADVNGDSCADKIYWNRGVYSGNVRVFLSNCNGTFKTGITSTNTASTSAIANHYFAKVNGDACEDLIYWNRAVDSGRTKVFMSNCNGTFKNAVSDTVGGASTSATAAFFFADVTGDGLADKIAWDPNASSGHTRVYRSAGNGTFPFLSEHASGGSTNAATQLFFADVTGDKKADKLVWRSDLQRGRIQIFPGTGTNFSNLSVIDNTGFSEASDTKFSFADIDGSGASDKVYWNSRVSSGGTRVYLARFPRP